MKYLEENLNVAYVLEGGSRDYLMNIDNVDFYISGFTMDISNIGRNYFDVYYDKECISWLLKNYLQDDDLDAEKDNYIEVINSSCYPNVYWRYWEKEKRALDLLKNAEDTFFQ